eukprot:maker-scaffold141_size315519-snap-gene-2.19 protein:Tk03989 transcript:maker-scaffold141_size315519-snap-gene-2.19-mRNA-1 annotation:"hypothetical protein DAPPUDRAFT_313164"
MKMAASCVKLNLLYFFLACLVVPINGTREKKLFSLFNVVQFKNDVCIAQSDTSTRGTCLSPPECTTRGGSPDGNCAAGFGVCCAFNLNGCGGVVNENCTNIRNAGFPSADTTISRTCTFRLNRICPGNCGNTGDSLTVRSPFSNFGAAFPPAVCGTLTGQHMYFETGTTGDAGSITIMTGTGNGDRRYHIKVTYIECCTAS